LGHQHQTEQANPHEKYNAERETLAAQEIKEDEIRCKECGDSVNEPDASDVAGNVSIQRDD
jgi:hypothetical protein